jgi:hypothetical protein
MRLVFQLYPRYNADAIEPARPSSSELPAKTGNCQNHEHVEVFNQMMRATKTYDLPIQNLDTLQPSYAVA